MRKGLLAMVLAMTVMLPAAAQDSLSVRPSFPRAADSPSVKPSFPLAVGSMLFANGFIHGMGRLTNFECSEVTMHSLRRNFRSGFEWDNDRYFMNQLGHPYQGGLSFNAARNNGFTFLQSAAFTVAGSFLWEYCGEKEPPSINDMITTSVAGTLFGECSHRLANRVLDNSDRGVRRVLREATAAFLNPLQGLERLLTGKMWKVRGNENQNENENENENACVSISLADRYVVAANGASHGSHHPFVAIAAEYGETADGEPHTHPYDFIDVDGALAFGGGQPVIPRLNVTARICSTPLTSHLTPLTSHLTPHTSHLSPLSLELGLYQFYKYDDTRLGDSLRGPFPFGETASFGPGLIIKSPQGGRLSFEQRLFARGVILGTAESDYYNCYDRQYNMGSGYGASSMTRLSWKTGSSPWEGQREAFRLQLNAYYLHLYTWRGYDAATPPWETTGTASQYPNVLGDRSHTRQLALDLQVQARLTPHCGLALGAAWFSRHTHYNDYPHHHADSYELRAGLLWEL